MRVETMAETHRGDSPLRGVAPSIFGPVWFYLTCPVCGERIRRPFARMESVLVDVHRYRGQHQVCRLLIVIGSTLESRIDVIHEDGDADQAMQGAIEQALKSRTA